MENDNAAYRNDLVRRKDLFIYTNATENEIAHIPAVDAVEVVRCRECIHADDYGHCEMQNFWGTRDDYCSRGKRREDGKV